MPRKQTAQQVKPAESKYQGLPTYARIVLDVVDRIPPGKVMAYGDIAEYVGSGGPRLVARIMSLYGDEVAWWRVLRADGTCAPEVADRQYEKLRDERVPFKSAERVNMTEARWSGQ